MTPDASIRRDTLRIDFPNDVSERVSVRIELIDRKCSREAVSLSVQRPPHVLANIGLGPTKTVPVWIPASTQSDSACTWTPGLLPNSQAETAGYWRPPGVHDFRPIAMPLGVAESIMVPSVFHWSLRHTNCTFHMPTMRHRLSSSRAATARAASLYAAGFRSGRCARAGISFGPYLCRNPQSARAVCMKRSRTPRVPVWRPPTFNNVLAKSFLVAFESSSQFSFRCVTHRK